MLIPLGFVVDMECVVVKRTRFGRHIYAVGGNAEAARRTGIRLKRRPASPVFAICSTMAAIGGTRACSWSIRTPAAATCQNHAELTLKILSKTAMDQLRSAFVHFQQGRDMMDRVFRHCSIGLTALVIAVSFTSLAASPAYATERGEFRILGVPLSKGGSATVVGEEEGEASIKVPSLNIEKHCKGFHILEGKILNEGIGDAKIEFLECTVFSIKPHEELSSCVIIPGKKITVEALLLVIKHEGKIYLLGEPKPGSTTFTVISFEKGLGCTLPLKNEVKGSYSAEFTTTAGVKLLVTSTGSALQKLLGDKLLFGVNETIIEGSAVASLTGVNAGCVWSVV